MLWSNLSGKTPQRNVRTPRESRSNDAEVGATARDSELRKANEFSDHRIPSEHDDLEDISESHSDLDEVSPT